MLFSRYRWAYEPLPGSASTSAVRKSRKRRILLIGLPAVVGVAVLWFAIRHFIYRRPYHPLDNYQKLNSLPIVYPDYKPAPFSSQDRAVVSSLYSDSFAIGVAVLGHSARSANVSARYILPYLEDRVSARSLCIARSVGWEPWAVSFIPPPHNGKDIHPRFRDQYTKLNIWSLDSRGIKTLVYLDADTLVRGNFSELFQNPFGFAAVGDVYGEDDPRGFSVTFNAGVLMLRPSTAVFEDMKTKIETATYPLKQAEQAFLNLYYAGKGLRLPYVYNANIAIKRRSPVLWESMKDEMRIVHYTVVKPFLDDSRPSGTILTPDEQREAIRLAKERDHGFYAEEVDWWREAYEGMLHDKGTEIAGCLLHLLHRITLPTKKHTPNAPTILFPATEPGATARD